MKRSIASVALLLAALTFAGPEGGAAKVLVLDLQRAVETCEEAREVTEGLQREKIEKQKGIDATMKELKEKSTKLKQKAPQEFTEEDLKQIREVNEQMGKLSGEADEFNVRISHKIQSGYQGRWQDATKFAREILKERGADAVFLTRTGPLKLNTDDQLTQEYVMRRVIVAEDSGQDITDAVIERMNKDYKDRAK